ncbi:hypothetical protein KBA63_04520 [Candidatus Woesebacteria bacterium]|jgi:hypothetical protein|nr:hypothetical protein [Candidatus Woesebacteria bacterium]MBP9687138.1 hypothetical protein [Candidatus Woesebacteria bacterium]
MDAHVVQNRPKTRRKSIVSPVLFAVFLLAAILPFLLLIFFSGQTFNFISQADEKSELRVWVTPSQIVASKGTEIELTVMAQYDHSNVLIPSVSIAMDTQGVPAIGSTIVTKLTPFKGEALIGKFTVKPTKSGTYVISPLKNKVVITPEIQDVDILVTPAKIVVK